MIDELASAQLKMRRAYQYLDVLKRELDAFTKTNPVTVVPQRNGDRTEEWWIPEVHREIPEIVPLLVGDCIHAMRSALDHLAWALASLKGPPHLGTAFPITTSREKFFERSKAKPTDAPGAPRKFSPTSGMTKIIGMRPGAQTYIERQQPYYGGRCTSLLLLNNLENQDKHRRLNVTFMIPSHWGHADPPGVEIKILRYALIAGAPFAHVTYPADGTEMDVNLYVAPDVGFIMNTGGPMEATELLKQLWWHVQSILRGALSLFGTREPDVYTVERVEFDRRYWEILQEPPASAL